MSLYSIISGVMLSLTAANGEAAIAVTWSVLMDDVAIDHYEVMYVVSQHPVEQTVQLPKPIL